MIQLDYKIHSHRNALTILENEPEYRETWAEIQHILYHLSDERIIECYQNFFGEKNKSLSTSINRLLKEDFEAFGWNTESPIFQEPQYKDIKGDYWRLDMAKDNISIEVAFNHSTVIAWNLLKPVLASELNHVQKAIQTKLGVIITATQSLKVAGNYDGAIGTFEKFLDHLRPMMNQLSVPLLIIGLEAPATFKLVERKVGNRKLGLIQPLV
ncbi:BglII/BstYI family type II restriction endonuclease [Peribacillus sp. SCS-37]|uniref:BglII/BstYI family type II restriction endonuclease n=1 Tax=Paraperibacillus esterisolvens TaxID=3115296 RepID=UPI003905AA95